MASVRKYLADIGRRGGTKSRRMLDPDTARDMVRVREARRAYRTYHASCFWSYRADLTITRDDVAWVAEQLMKHAHETILAVGALCWAAVGKDPGFTPLSLLELLKRRSRYRPEDFARLDLVTPFDLVAAKTLWLRALSDAERPHWGVPGGVLPQLPDASSTMQSPAS